MTFISVSMASFKCPSSLSLRCSTACLFTTIECLFNLGFMPKGQSYTPTINSYSGSSHASFVWPSSRSRSAQQVWLQSCRGLQDLLVRSMSSPRELKASSVIRCKTGVTEPPISTRTCVQSRKESLTAICVKSSSSTKMHNSLFDKICFSKKDRK